MKKSVISSLLYLLCSFVFVIFLYPSNLMAEVFSSPKDLLCKAVFQKKNESLPKGKREGKIKRSIRNEIENLLSEENFSKYKSAQGLLRLSYDLSKVKDNTKVSLIFETVKENVDFSDFIELDWKPFNENPHWKPFNITRVQMDKLMRGFFNEYGFIRRSEGGGERAVFLLEETEESLPISGEQGFERFVERVFYGNRDEALVTVVDILSVRNMEFLEWDEVLSLKMGRKSKKQIALEEEIEDQMLEELIKENLAMINRPTPFDRRVKELVRDYSGEKVLEQFFERLLNIDTSNIRSGETTVVRPLKILPREEQENFKPDEDGNIRIRLVDASLVEYLKPDGPFVAMRAHYHLTVNAVKEFLSILRNRKILFDYLNTYESWPEKHFIGFLLFHKAEREALKMAKEAGLFLVQIPIDENSMEDLKLEQLKLRNSEKFQPAHF